MSEAVVGDSGIGKRLVGVGVGPGDPRLLTVAAVEALRTAPIVLVPTSDLAEPGRAEAVVAHYVPAEKIRRIEFLLGRSGDRDAVWERAAAQVIDYLEQHGWACFATLGDPCLYSTYYRLAQGMRKLGFEGQLETIPGIAAFQALAAEATIPLALEDDPVLLVSGNAALERLHSALAAMQPGSVVVYKIGSNLAEIAQALGDIFGVDSLVYGTELGTPNAKLYEGEEVPQAPPRYLGTLVAGRRVAGVARGEAEVARTGISSQEESSQEESPHREAGQEESAAPGAGRPGKVFFVGAGPGAEDLLTLRAVRLLGQADLVVWAGSLVNPKVLQYVRSGCRVQDSSRLTRREIEALLGHAKAGATVVRLCSGDPAIYSAISEQIDYCIKNEIPYEIVPGVSSLSAAASAIGTELTSPGVAQAVAICRYKGRTTEGRGEHPGPGVLAHPGTTLAIFLSVDRAADVADELIAAGLDPSTPACVVYRASWPEEVVERTDLEHLGEVTEKLGIRRQALILVGQALAAEQMALPSKLYDPAFGHGFRKSRHESKRRESSNTIAS
jgi:precorrin-4/cobalt-precorrin-4 C11-methyltransferase